MFLSLMKNTLYLWYTKSGSAE